MRHARFLMAAPALVLSGAAIWASGCSTFADDCLGLSDPDCSKALGSSAATTSTSTTTTTGSSTSTGVVPGCHGMPEDILAPATVGNYVNEDCGVFVQADALDEMGDGTKAKPFKTIGAAIAGAKGKAVFACATSQFEEKLDISAPLSLYGGFDCTKDWSWDIAARSVVTGKPDEIPVTIAKSATSVTIWNVAVKAADASKDSGSSIGMAIDDVSATLTRCDVTAGAGYKGVAGMSQAGSAAPGVSAATNVAAGCVTPFGALPGKTTCGGTKTDGGVGGLGGDTSSDGGKGQTGGNGSPTPTGPEGRGGAGDGQPNASTCSAGVSGKFGDNGGAGVAGATKDTVLSLSGVNGGSGGDGKPGLPGQGGGGGGGTRAGNFCGPSQDMPGFGPGGGGGGSGGCGGLGGLGGQAGGSSIAILSLGIQVKLNDVVLTTSAGGNGGAGGKAQMGGGPGTGAVGGNKIKPGFNAGCDGGNGGNGGNGGEGGGGRGGHSVGIAFAGTPSMGLMPQFTGGAAGSGGNGGNKGMAGAAAACWDFSTNAACPK